MRLIDLLNRHIDECYKKYTNVDLKQLENLKKKYYASKTTEKSLYPLVLFIIKNNTLDVRIESDNKIYDKHNFDKTDDRIPHIFDLINKTLSWALKNNKHIPDTTIYFWISDRIPWYDDIDKKFPIFVFAKPINKNFIVFPDNTFSCMTIHKKYNGICYDWDGLKKMIIDKTEKLEFDNKINKIFFKGTPSTANNSKIRENLREFSKSTDWLSIDLDAWNTYISIVRFGEYKYLLNLSGHYPWSNRFKYLFLMNSIVINVDIESINTETNEIEPKWISFINLIIKPNKHYINMKFKFYYSKNKDDKMKNRTMNYNESVIIFHKLKKIFENDPSKYLQYVKKGYERVSRLKNKHIYEYIYNCIVRNSQVNFV